ncbi:MAG: hypothetical protein FWC69_03280 [Defluviitaleaceae bacterium]|nr:hypothetical protein [Defluviitaleaceae bacterium]
MPSLDETYASLLKACRLKFALADDEDLQGRLFVSSGLGKEGYAQPKAMEMACGVSVIAEVDKSRVEACLTKGWVRQVCHNPKEAFDAAMGHLLALTPYSIAYNGNIVELLQYACMANIPIDILSDQTSCRDIFSGGYAPLGLCKDEMQRLMSQKNSKYRWLVGDTLLQHHECIKILTGGNAHFLDFGNGLLEVMARFGLKI